MLKIIRIALAILLASCNDPKVANEKNFGPAIQKYLETAYPKCYLEVGLPTTRATSNPIPTYSSKPLLAFVSAGLVSENEVSRTDIPMGPVIVKKSYDLTAQGKKFYTPNVSKTIGGKGIGGFCLGKGSLKAVSHFSEPTDMMGYRVSHVSYTYVVSGMPEWAKSQKFSDALPKLKADADSHARPVEAVATLILTSDGWIHEELFQRKSANNTGPRVSQEERTLAKDRDLARKSSVTGRPAHILDTNDILSGLDENFCIKTEGRSICVGPGAITQVGAALRVGIYRYTATAGNHVKEVIKSGEFVGQLARPYMNSPQTIREILKGGRGVSDPGGVPGALRYDVPGTFRNSKGTWQLVHHPETNMIYHFNFVRAAR